MLRRAALPALRAPAPGRDGSGISPGLFAEIAEGPLGLRGVEWS